MTCREFKHSAAALTLWELSQGQDRQVLSHAESCESCGGWLRKQRTLAGSMQKLQLETASLEAGPHVEQALLGVFRQAAQARPHTVQHQVKPLRPAVAARSTPVAMRLSRFFEVGAYLAVAAAILVAVFLGVQLLQHSHHTGPVQSHIAPTGVAPTLQQPAATTADAASRSTVSTDESTRAAMRGRAPQPKASGIASATTKIAADQLQANAEDGYVALMFCDPLSCSSESQVVRMELPPSPNASSQGAQPQMADVVVGYDGVVRAVRIVD
jgi:hypothetical protein